MSDRILTADAFTTPLRRASHPGIWTEGGWPTAATEPLAELGSVAVSLWEMTEGVVADIENDECLLVLRGAGSIRFEDGDLVELAPGAMVRLSAGERTEWTVTQTLRAVLVSGRLDSDKH